MKAFTGYKAEKATGKEQLPAGGYVAKIMECKEVSYDWGTVILVSFEIAEGAQKGFFGRDYKAQATEDKKWRGTMRLVEPKEDGSEKDGWTIRSFNNAIWSFETSNPGYHWDWNEAGLKDKLVGVLYRNREWEFNGRQGWATECCALTDTDSIRAGTFKMPKDKPLAVKTGDNTAFAAIENYEELPF